MKKIRHACVIILLCSLFTMGCGADAGVYLESVEAESQSETPAEEVVTATEQDGDLIFIYICGEVEKPGVYELSTGSRVCDAVEAAGGMTEEASREYWNLAELLTDGEMLYFPTVSEAKERAAAAAEEAAALEDDGLININTADSTELQKIPGVGESRAEAIISYRRQNGSFSSIEDIMKVSGIADGLFDRMKDYIKV